MKKSITPCDSTTMWGHRCLGGIKWSVAVTCGGVLLIGLFLLSPIKVYANSLSLSCPYEDGIPDNIRQYCELVGSEYDICPELLEAMAYNESRFEPDVVNGNHYGLLQVNVKTHKARIEKYGWTAEDMFDPYKNLMVAGDFLHELYTMYGDENPIVLAYYSGNSSAIKRYLKTGEMCSYAKKILEHSAEYERIHGK